MGDTAAGLSVVPAPVAASYRLEGLRSVGLFVGLLVAIAATEAAHGGYFPDAWGWTTAAFAWVAAVALLLRRERIFDRSSLAFTALLAAFAGWTLLSLA